MEPFGDKIEMIAEEFTDYLWDIQRFTAIRDNNGPVTDYDELLFDPTMPRPYSVPLSIEDRIDIRCLIEFWSGLLNGIEDTCYILGIEQKVREAAIRRAGADAVGGWLNIEGRT